MLPSQDYLEVAVPRRVLGMGPKEISEQEMPGSVRVANAEDVQVHVQPDAGRSRKISAAGDTILTSSIVPQRLKRRREGID